MTDNDDIGFRYHCKFCGKWHKIYTKCLSRALFEGLSTAGLNFGVDWSARSDKEN